jgi:hypothetical protein
MEQTTTLPATPVGEPAAGGAAAPRPPASLPAPVPIERMGAFFQRLGHRVVQTPGASWYDFYRGFYVSFPHHAQVTPGRADLGRLFRGLALGVRYVAPPGRRADAPGGRADAPGGPESAGRASYAMMCADPAYDLAGLSGNTRSKVRRGLSRCRIERLDPAFVRAQGRPAHDDTLARIGVRDPYPWDTYWRAVEQSPDCVEVWGALAGDELVAYLVGVLADRCFEIMVARSRTEALRYYPNNALVYTVVREMLARPGMESIWFGIESLEGADSVDEFKLSMGFVKAPIRQRIVLHPLLGPVIRSAPVMRLVGALAERQPQNEMWRKLRRLADFERAAGTAAG